jgi:hypothetical protein
MPFLILLELEHLLCDSSLGDDVNFDAVSRVDVALACSHEAFLDKLDRLGGGERGLRVRSVLPADEVVQQGNDQLLAGALRCILYSLEGAHRVVSENCAFALVVNTSDNLHIVKNKEKDEQHNGVEGKECLY